MPVYVVDKPLGLSSHDVVARARRLLGTRRVGHAGTLDPLATGVLVLLSDAATKLSPFLSASDKTYLAWVSFGAGTATLDAEGPVTEEADAGALAEDAIREALPPFLELREQRPPAFSAIKRSGVKGYEAARRGETLALEPRPAGYHATELLAFADSREALPKAFSPTGDGSWQAAVEGRSFELPPALGTYPTALFALRVQAGTYIRAFARDLGLELGVPAHLSGLVRTRAGRQGLEQAVSFEALPETPGLGLADALPYPRLVLSEDEAARVRLGQRLPGEREGRLALVTSAGDLVAVAEVQQGRMKLLRVWH